MLKETIKKKNSDSSVDTEIRLNKYLSDAGFCSRREADRLIEAARVTVDDTPASMGQRIRKDQVIKVDGKAVNPEKQFVMIAYNKPVGVECTTDRDNKDNIIDRIGYPARIFPVGRLDKNSSGLILLTNEGSLSDRILRGSNYHEKEYEVTVNKLITKDFLEQMVNGVEIELEDGKKKVITRKCRVTPLGKTSFSIVLTQGLNRQIRRMCQALGYKVTALKRIRIININLGNLPEGHYRNVTESETYRLLKELEISK